MMATSSRSNAKTKMGKAKTKKALEDENEKLRDTVERLKKVNAQQVLRLTQQSLLEIRIKELEQQLARDRDE